MKDLEKLGLTEKEITVYMVLLKIGKATIEMIAKDAGYARTSTYTQVETLTKLGLMSSFVEGKKTYYVAESPSNLERLLQKQKQILADGEVVLEKIMPELSSLYNRGSKKPIVRFFPGKEGIITMREEVLLMKEKQLYVASSFDKFKKVFTDPEERNAFTKKRTKKGIKTRLLFSSSEVLIPDTYAPEEFRQVSEKEFPFEFDIYIFDNKVAISSLTDELWGVIIEGTAVSKSMRMLFNMAWQFAEKKAGS